MSKSWKGCLWQLGLTSSLVIGGEIVSANLDFAFAQSIITPDKTLGTESSRVIPSPFNNSSELLTGGAVRGNNLFHSFLEFNVGKNRGAFFVSPNSNIQNIVARVTGNNPSQILGVLGTLQISNGNADRSNANLFLINPNGIIFGPNAALNLGGSFVASTASAVKFADGSQFSATTPQTTPLLTVSVPIGLQFGKAVGDIQVQGGLNVEPGKTLALVGGNVNLDGALLFAPSGQIALGGILGAGTIGLNLDSNNLPLTFPNNVALADVSLSHGVIADVSGDRGGNIQVQGRLVTLTDRSGLFADTQSQNGRGISIQASQLTIQGGSEISASTSDAGSGGTITVNASDSVQVNGTYADGSPSGLFTTTFGEGAAGSLTINTGQLIVQNGGNVSASTEQGSRGSGGTLKVTANSIRLSGTSVDRQNPSDLLAQTLGSGDAGSLIIDTRQLIVENGAQVTAGANIGSQGKGGNLIVHASDSVELSGTAPNGLFTSGLSVRSRGTGDAGSLTINTGQLTVRNGAQVTVESLGSGNAGNLQIQARSIRLDQGTLKAGTTSGQGGNITLNLQDFLLLRHNSGISANAGTAQLGGDGGNITINAPFLVAVPQENSDITANAFSGRGGKVTINAQGLFFLEPRSRQDLQQQLQPTDPTKLDPALLSTNDITAISQENPNLNGLVTINTPDIDPSRGLVTLPTSLLDASGQIVRGCAVRNGKTGNEFTVTGRGGLPPSPYEPLSGDVVWSDTRLNSTTGQRHNTKTTTTKPPSTPDTVEINPATGWVFNGKGEVTLIANAPNATPYSLGPCYAPKK